MSKAKRPPIVMIHGAFVGPWSFDEFRKLMPAFEAKGQQLDRTPRSVFKGPDISRYELLQPLPGTRAPLPPDVRKLLNWSEEDAKSAGAYPVRK